MAHKKASERVNAKKVVKTIIEVKKDPMLDVALQFSLVKSSICTVP